MQSLKFTEKAQDAVVEAQPLAEQHNNATVDVEHLLVALLSQGDGVVPQLVQKMGKDPVEVGQLALAEVERLSKVHGTSQVYMAPTLRKVIQVAEENAKNLKDEFVSTEHLFLAIADPQTDGPAGRLLRAQGITREKILEALPAVRGNQRVNDPNPEGKYQALEKYGRDLTDLARKGKIDPVIGRDEENRRVMQVLSRRTKNNPVLIGEPGVGKTAIAEGLAQRIISGDVPDSLKQKRVYCDGHWGDGGGREIPWRIRRSPESVFERSDRFAGPDHFVHRRIAHYRWRRCSRRLGGRVEHAQANAGAR